MTKEDVRPRPPREDLEKVIEALQFKDLEIVEALTEINRCLVLGVPQPATLIRDIERGRTFEHIPLDIDAVNERLVAVPRRRLGRILRRYEELRQDSLKLLQAFARDGRIVKSLYRRFCDETIELVTFIEDNKTDIWDIYAATDELTGLLNRTALQTILDREQRRCSRTRATLSIALLDIDDFKVINDTHGHDAGDAVLVAISNVILDSVRSFDFVLRLGGEEILVLLPRTPAGEARRVLDRVRRNIAAAEITVADGLRLSVTVSIGVAGFRQGKSMDDVLKKADEALYSAKESGKNRVCEAVRDR